jgi:hypothetical protein
MGAKNRALPIFLRSWSWFKVSLLIGVLAALWSGPAMALAGTPLYPCDRDRLGFGVVYGIQNYDVAPLQAGWYVNWGATSPTPHPAGLDYTQIIRTGEGGYSPTGSNLAALIASNPGSLWLIGNEPDCPYQDNVTPRTYARL